MLVSTAIEDGDPDENKRLVRIEAPKAAKRARVESVQTPLSNPEEREARPPKKTVRHLVLVSACICACACVRHSHHTLDRCTCNNAAAGVHV
jgi:hypothetical protein